MAREWRGASGKKQFATDIRRVWHKVDVVRVEPATLHHVLVDIAHPARAMPHARQRREPATSDREGQVVAARHVPPVVLPGMPPASRARVQELRQKIVPAGFPVTKVGVRIDVDDIEWRAQHAGVDCVPPAGEDLNVVFDGDAGQLSIQSEMVLEELDHHLRRPWIFVLVEAAVLWDARARHAVQEEIEV